MPASSNVTGFSYNAETRELEVEFKGGRRYRYSNIPPELHKSFEKATSLGAFVNSHLAGRFPTEKLE